MNKNLSTGLAVVALVLGLIGVFRPAQVERVVEKLTAGAVSSPNIPSPYLQWGGVNFWAQNQTMNQGTTTVCALQSPAATSTLVSGTVGFTVSSTSATTVTVARQTQGFSTTTRDFNNSLIRTQSIAANAKGDFQTATTSLTALSTAQSDVVFAPNSYLVVTMAGGIGTFSPEGNCTALWQQADY